MPILTFRSNNLQGIGAIIEVILVPSHAVGEKLKSEGKLIPSIKVIGLIDTGASTSCISQTIVDSLGLVPYDAQEVFHAGGASRQLFYDVGLILPVTQNMIMAVQAPCADLSKQPYQVLIGRDVLRFCTLFYNGNDNSFTISF